MKFNPPYFSIFLIFLITEVMIALYIKDDFIRPYLGDTFVVILIYCLIRSFLNLPMYPTILAVLLFSYCIEIMQYFKLVELLGLEEFTLAKIIIGTSFSWGDVLAYTAGAAIIAITEYFSGLKHEK